MQDKREEKSFLLVNLGTDTNYTPKLKQGPKDYAVTVDAIVPDYPKGETLSIIATLAEPGGTPQIDPTNPRPYQSPKVVVVNGPDTLGRSVGAKIAQGLASALHAITRGQTSLNIIAHSRGAVESILVAHELEAIQNAIDGCATLNDLIKRLAEQQKARYAKPPTNNTPDIIPTLRALLPPSIDPKAPKGSQEAQKEQDRWFQSLKDNIKNASINFFGIDPVPGDCGGRIITWHDERYFRLPAIVKKAQIIYYENERSDWGFSPAFVEGTPGADQDFVRLTMLGHHGTGSTGSQGSQRNVVVAEKHEKTSHVQKLMIYKILDFLNQNDVPFSDASAIFKKHTGLGTKYAKHYKHPTQEEVSIEEARAAEAHGEETPPSDAQRPATKAIDVKRLDFKKIFEELYGEIVTRRSGYAKFNKTHYQAMGVLQGGRRLLCKDAKTGGHTYRALADEFPLDQDYINDEHALLMQDYFFRLFKLRGTDADEGAAALIKRAHDILQENIEKACGSEDPSGFWMPGVTTDVTLRSARADILKTFTAIVQKVSEQYLKEDWIGVEKQAAKEEIFTEVIKLFKTLKKLNNSPEVNGELKKFTTDLITQSLDGITKTIEYKHNELVDKFNTLQQSPNDKLTLFFSSVLKQHLQEVDSEARDQLIEAQIKELLEDPEYITLENHPIDAKIIFIWEKLIRKYPTLAGGADNPVLRLKENFNEQFGDKLDEFEALYQQIQIFIDDLGGLRREIQEKTAVYDQCELSLHQKVRGLIETAAQRFYKEREPDHLPDIAPKGSFSDLAERHAINKLGLVDRAHESHLALQKQAQDLQQRLFHERDGKKVVERDLAKEREQRLELERQLHEKTVATEGLERKLATEQEQGRSLALQLEDKTAAIKELERNLTTEQEQGRSLALQLEERTATIEDLERNLDTERKQGEELAQQLNKQTTTVADLEHRLTAEKEKGLAQQVHDKTISIEELERTLDIERKRAEELTRQLREKGVTKEGLERNLDTERKRAEELTQQLREKEVTKEGLERNLATERKQGQELTQQLSAKTAIIEDLERNLTLERKRVDELTQQLRNATGSKERIDSDLDAEKTKAAEFHQAMNDKKEAQLLLLITDKLRPLTEEYLTSLIESKDTGALKATKMARVEKLLECLNDDNSRPKPSARVRAFYTELNDAAAKELKTHRDKAWHRYIRNTLVVAGILISGILPGLLALAIYRNTGHSDTKSAFFWKSAGDNTVNTLNKARPKLDNIADSDADTQEQSKP